MLGGVYRVWGFRGVGRFWGPISATMLLLSVAVLQDPMVPFVACGLRA